MGTKTKAICKCGYASEYILIGGGKMNFQYTQYYPCLCMDCKDVVQVNLKGILNCQKCNGSNIIPYDDERLRGEYKEPEYNTTMYHDVTNGLYYCPKCDKKTLKFMPSMFMWD